MKSSASRASERSQQPDRPLVDPARVPRGRRPARGAQKSLSAVIGAHRGARIDERTLSSNLPGQIPVSPGEAELVRVYFADQISAVLKECP